MKNSTFIPLIAVLVCSVVWLSLHASRMRPPEPAAAASAVCMIAKPGETIESPGAAAEMIVAGAKAQAREGALYTPGYFRIPYPNGDLPRDKGVCADVVVRALRCAGHDLQKLVHEDMAANFSAYPQRWGLPAPDSNIDHRRVPNLMTFFRRHALTLTTDTGPGTRPIWQAGDIVCWKLDNGLDHCGIVSDHRNAAGLPLVIHNMSKCAEEDCLTRWRITGHFRYPSGR
jgi:hypothetical protein